MPLNNPMAGAQVASGEYTGNNTVNRFIPHGLTVKPRLVCISKVGGSYWYWIFGDRAAILVSAAGENSSLPVTIPDKTNFHVGNATNYNFTANANTFVYSWVAIG